MAKRNIFAKTTILYACSTEFTEGTDPDSWLHPLCTTSVQDRRFRDVVSLRRLYPEVAKFAAALGVLTFGFCLLTFDLRVRRALGFNVGFGDPALGEIPLL